MRRLWNLIRVEIDEASLSPRGSKANIRVRIWRDDSGAASVNAPT
jgi:hypothetical protein